MTTYARLDRLLKAPGTNIQAPEKLQEQIFKAKGRTAEALGFTGTSSSIQSRETYGVRSACWRFYGRLEVREREQAPRTPYASRNRKLSSYISLGLSFSERTRNAIESEASSITLAVGLPAPWPARVSMRMSVGWSPA